MGNNGVITRGSEVQSLYPDAPVPHCRRALAPQTSIQIPVWDALTKSLPQTPCAWTEPRGASLFFYYTSPCFFLPNWYILYFGAFNQNLNHLVASPSASGVKAHSCSAPLSSHPIVSLLGGRWGHFSYWQDFGRTSSPLLPSFDYRISWHPSLSN